MDRMREAVDGPSLRAAGTGEPAPHVAPGTPEEWHAAPGTPEEETR
ncbi:hypothetical protein ACFVYF_08300 [Streptomyces sp. NPDC058274]|jgi:hypothetical protein|nr:hypothetical protein [Streptomyces sp.]